MLNKLNSIYLYKCIYCPTTQNPWLRPSQRALGKRNEEMEGRGALESLFFFMIQNPSSFGELKRVLEEDFRGLKNILQILSMLL